MFFIMKLGGILESADGQSGGCWFGLLVKCCVSNSSYSLQIILIKLATDGPYNL